MGCCMMASCHRDKNVTLTTPLNYRHKKREVPKGVSRFFVGAAHGRENPFMGNTV